MQQEFSSIPTVKQEVILPYAKSPWSRTLEIRIQDRDIAIERASKPPAMEEWKVFTDGSVGKGLAGVGVYVLFRLQSGLLSNAKGTKTIARESEMNAYGTELTAILHALETCLNSTYFVLHASKVTIISDSQSSLQALQHINKQSGQSILLAIDNLVSKANDAGKTVKFEWAPAHSKVAGNTKADRLAKMATENNRIPPKAIQLRSITRQLLQPILENTRTSLFEKDKKTGRYSRNLDKALPGKHTRKLYASLSREEASVLSQLRTGKCRLNEHLQRICITESADCVCGQAETVRHFIIECSQWQQQRQILRQEVRQRPGDLAFLLGAWSGPKVDGARVKWKPNMAAVRATIKFALATGRLQQEQN